MHVNQLQAPMFVFQIMLFSQLTSITFVYKIEWYHELLQIVTHQLYGTNLLFLQDYLKSTASKRMRIYFGFYLLT